ncbi:MAG: ASCH domain-containing protein [Oscillospiraceae bacterium]|nr:ASCH domain-containing protein [Oscillospiraceae bacterium]
MLILPIKRHWFNMLLSGEKKEEYREIKPYYISRLAKYVNKSPFWAKFVNGYSHTSPSFNALVQVKYGIGKTEWGAEPNTEYFVLSIITIEE